MPVVLCLLNRRKSTATPSKYRWSGQMLTYTERWTFPERHGKDSLTTTNLRLSRPNLNFFSTRRRLHTRMSCLAILQEPTMVHTPQWTSCAQCTLPIRLTLYLTTSSMRISRFYQTETTDNTFEVRAYYCIVTYTEPNRTLNWFPT